MNNHKNKHIREAVDYALEQGWRLVIAGPRRMPGGVCFARKAIAPVVKSRFTPPHGTRKIMLDGSGDTLILARTQRDDKKEHSMKCYEFIVILRGLDVIDEDLADKLFEAGCDDGSPFSLAASLVSALAARRNHSRRPSARRSPTFKRRAVPWNASKSKAILHCWPKPTFHKGPILDRPGKTS